MSTVTALDLNISVVEGKIKNQKESTETLKKQLRPKVITSIFLGIMATLFVGGTVALGGITATVIGLGIEFAGLSLTAIFAIAFIAVALLFVVSVVLWIIFGVVVSKAKGNNESLTKVKTNVESLTSEKTQLVEKRDELEENENKAKEKKLIEDFKKENSALLRRYLDSMDEKKEVKFYEDLKKEVNALKMKVEKLSDSNEKTALLEEVKGTLETVEEQINYMKNPSPKTPKKDEIPKNYFLNSPGQTNFNRDMKNHFIKIKNKLSKEKEYKIEELKDYKHIDLKKSLNENLNPMKKVISEKLESMKNEKNIKINKSSIFNRFKTYKQDLKGKQIILYQCILAKRILKNLEIIGKMKTSESDSKNQGDISPVDFIPQTPKKVEKNPKGVNSPITKKTTKDKLMNILKNSARGAKKIVDGANPNFTYKIKKNENQLQKINEKYREIFAEIKRLKGTIDTETEKVVKSTLGDFSTHIKIKKNAINRARYYKILEKVLNELKTYKEVV